jgi:TatD DNase family protein
MRRTSSQSAAMAGLIDIGLNLTHDSFDRDREAVLDAAQSVGVERFIVTGSSIDASQAAVTLARKQPGTLFATAGVHPHHASDLDDRALTALEALAQEPAVVAVGECGLDFFRNFSPEDAQLRAFVAQLELAATVGKPVFLHQRDAHEPFVAALEPRRDALCGGVAHCFTGGPDELEAYLDLGLYIGVTGWLCDPARGEPLRSALPAIPLDRLLIETDAPYLLPKDLPDKPRNRRNEPRYLVHVLSAIAALRSEPIEEIARATRDNTVRLFNLRLD